MATRRRTGLGGGFGDQGLNTSSTDTSGTKWWLNHKQSFYGMYERRNAYNGAVSSNTITAPAVTFNELLLSMKVTTTDELVYADFSAGTFNQYQTLEIISNHTSGGFGTSGAVTTSAVGMLRRPALLDAVGNPTDLSGTCESSYTLSLDKSLGPYDLDGQYDTSATISTTLYEIMKTAKDNCRTFEVFLVTL